MKSDRKGGEDERKKRGKDLIIWGEEGQLGQLEEGVEDVNALAENRSAEVDDLAPGTDGISGFYGVRRITQR